MSENNNEVSNLETPTPTPDVNPTPTPANNNTVTLTKEELANLIKEEVKTAMGQGAKIPLPVKTEDPTDIDYHKKQAKEEEEKRQMKIKDDNIASEWATLKLAKYSNELQNAIAEIDKKNITNFEKVVLSKRQIAKEFFTKNQNYIVKSDEQRFKDFDINDAEYFYNEMNKVQELMSKNSIKQVENSLNEAIHTDTSAKGKHIASYFKNTRLIMAKQQSE